MLRIIESLSFMWLIMAISTIAQNTPVLDTEGQPLRTGFEYQMEPAAVDSALGVTLATRNGSCPLYLAQNPGRGGGPSIGPNIPVSFKPYATGETVIREGRDLTITMSAVSDCVQSTVWTQDHEEDPQTRRFIVVGGETDYFRIVNNDGLYNIMWCPTEVCPVCRFNCGYVGILIENGIRYLVLVGEGDASNFIFIRS